MSVRGFTAKTQHDYLRSVAGFAAFLERSPSTATPEDIRRFQIEQSERGTNAPAMNSAVAAMPVFQFVGPCCGNRSRTDGLAGYAAFGASMTS